MAARNPDASTGSDPNGFHASRPRDEPLTTHGHQIGQQVGNDAAPEFSAQTLPAGSAPADRTFKPNNASEVPPTNDSTSAQDTIGGATSAQVHTGYGHPGQGQTSSELRHDKSSGSGLDGLASGAQGKTVDSRLPENAGQRNLGDDAAAANSGTRGNVGGPAAQDRI